MYRHCLFFGYFLQEVDVTHRSVHAGESGLVPGATVNSQTCAQCIYLYAQRMTKATCRGGGD